MPHEIGVFVRSPAELDRARAATEDAGLPFKVLDDNVETTRHRNSWMICEIDTAMIRF